MSGIIYISPSGEKKFLFQEDIAAAEQAGWTPAPGQTTMVDDEYWDSVEVGAGEVGRRTRLGQDFQITPMDVQSERGQWNADEEEYGSGLGNTLAAAGIGALSGLTFGLSDIGFKASGVDIDAYAAHNPYAHGIGLGGAILGTSLLGGAGAVGNAGKASKLGKLLAKTPAGAVSRGATKLGQRIGGTKGLIAGEMVEGLAYGTGQAVSQLVISNEPLTAEAVSSELLRGGLLGAAAGGVGAGAFALGAKAFSGLKGLRANKKAAILDYTTDEGRVFTGDIARSMREFDDAGAAALGAKYPKEVQEQLSAALEAERKALLDEIDELEAVGLGYMQRAGGDLRRAEKELSKLEKDLAQVGRKADSDVEREMLREVKAEEKLRGRQTANIGRKRKMSDTVPEARAADTVPDKRAISAERAGDTVRDLHAEQRVGLRAGLDRMAQASENFKVRRLRQLDKLDDTELATLAANSREYAEAIDDLGRLLGVQSPAVRQFADTVQDRLPKLLNMYREHQTALLGGPLGAELASARQAVRKVLGVKDDRAIGPKHISDIFRKSPDDQVRVFEAIDNHFKVARKIAEETGDTAMLEGVEATLGSLKSVVGEAVDPAMLEGLKLSDLVVAAGIAEVTPDFEGPVDDIAKLFLAHKLVSGRAGTKGGNFVRKALGNVGARMAAQKGWQHAGAVGAGVGSAAGYKVFAGLGDRLGVAGGLSTSTSKTMRQIADSVHRLAQGAATGATKGATTATAILKATQFRAQEKREEERERSLRELFKQRSEELHELMRDPWQLQVMINDSLEPVRQTHAGLGDKIEMQTMRTLQHIYDTMPKDPGTLKRFGVSRWEPSEYDVHRWTRRLEAAQNPMKVVEDTLSGGSVTPQAAETLRELYPAIFQEVQLKLVEQMPALQANSTYDKRIKLSTLYGVALDPAMERKTRDFVQQMQVQESQQQAQAPQARPSSTTSSEEPTGAQKLLAR